MKSVFYHVVSEKQFVFLGSGAHRNRVCSVWLLFLVLLCLPFVVSKQDNTKTIERITAKLSGMMWYGLSLSLSA